MRSCYQLSSMTKTIKSHSYIRTSFYSKIQLFSIFFDKHRRTIFETRTLKLSRLISYFGPQCHSLLRGWPKEKLNFREQLELISSVCTHVFLKQTYSIIINNSSDPKPFFRKKINERIFSMFFGRQRYDSTCTNRSSNSKNSYQIAFLTSSEMQYKLTVVASIISQNFYKQNCR